MLRIGLLLGFSAVFLQIAVFLQPLLPKQYQIAPVCETITQLLVQTQQYANQHSFAPQHGQMSMMQHQHLSHEMHQHNVQLDKSDQHTALTSTSEHLNSGHDHHDSNHQCQYCTVYAHLILPPELDVKEVLNKIQIRLIAFQKTFRHVYFVLQRLYLLPQGRAPPLFA